LVAWFTLREDYTAPQPSARTVRGRRIRRFAAIPLTVVAAAMVLLEVASLAKGAVAQYPAYSLARSNFDALAGDTCGLANDVLVEPDRSEEHTSELQSRENLVCRLLLEKQKKNYSPVLVDFSPLSGQN